MIDERQRTTPVAASHQAGTTDVDLRLGLQDRPQGPGGITSSGSALKAPADRRDLLHLNMGPQHPSTHGVLRLELLLDGEIVYACRPVIGYLHTGIEKTFEHKTYVQGVVLTDR